MNLIIDEGNTLTKVALYEEGTQHFFKAFEKETFEKAFWEEVPLEGVTQAMIASVTKGAEERFSFLKPYMRVLYLTALTPVPFVNRYATPHSLGTDRIALVVGAMKRYPQRNVLVIDMGTCITFDLITCEKEYLGGAIAPGIGMRLKAMHQYTDKLPLIEEQPFDTENFIGNNTTNCMLSGVYHNALCEIEGVKAAYEQRFEQLVTILTGGNHFYLAERIKSTIFAHSFVLLEGMNAILEYQKRL